MMDFRDVIVLTDNLTNVLGNQQNDLGRSQRDIGGAEPTGCQIGRHQVSAKL